MRQTNAVGGSLHLHSGLTLGRYELVLRVARGAMGEVWAARLRREHGFQKLFALKVLRPELCRDPTFERMFLEEAALAARIRHPNVVSVVDLGEQEGTLFLVMEWVCGEPLAAVLRAARGRPAPPLAAARIAYQVCAGLEAAHELCDDDGRPLGLVHCDVSPENLLITSEGLVRLVDFGVAIHEGTPLSERTRGGVSPRDAGVADLGPRVRRARQELRGTAPYMAPEHILGEPSDRRADVFAVGILLYELLAGAHPFLSEDDQITMDRIASASPAEPPSSRFPKKRDARPSWRPSGGLEAIPPALDRLVSAALAKSPHKRTPTAAELMRGLEEAVPGAEMQSSDAAVAFWVAGVLGDARELRARKLREALEAARRGLSDREAMAHAAGAPRAVGRPAVRPRARRGARAACAAVLAIAGCALIGLAARDEPPPSIATVPPPAPSGSLRAPPPAARVEPPPAPRPPPAPGPLQRRR